MTDLEEGMHRRAETLAIGDEIAELSAHMDAAVWRLLERLREFDARGGWSTFRSCAHWLSWRTGIDPGAAREKVRTANALAVLPQVSDALRRGQLSFTKVRAITRVATPENEGKLLEIARIGTAAHVEKIVRAWRRVDRIEEQAMEGRRHASRELQIFQDDDGMFVIRGRLDPEAGVLLRKALELAVEEQYGRFGERNPQERATIGQKRADALGLVAERAIAAKADGKRVPAEVVVHIDAAMLSESAIPAADMSEHGEDVSAETSQSAIGVAKGGAVLDGDVHVSAETARRLACEARVRSITHSANPEVTEISRRGRTVPPGMRRALEHRDGGCRFPGCRMRLCDAHHVKHWVDGGLTIPGNLMLLCRLHHRAVHEGGYRVAILDGRATFHSPDGRVIDEAPRPPALPENPVAAMIAEHRVAGLEIDPDTSMSQWKGERWDLGWTVGLLRGRRDGLSVEY